MCLRRTWDKPAKAIVRRLLFVFSWVLAVAALAYLVYRLVTFDNYAALGQTLLQASWHEYMALGLALVLIPVQLGVEAFRWQYALRGWKTISWKESWDEVLLGMMAGFVTPYRAGDIPARLVAAGLDISADEWKARWRSWLKDMRKWIAVVAYTLLRYMVWGVQLWAVLYAVGIGLSPWQALVAIAVYYVVISVMPALPAADVPLKGGWAVAIFGQYTDNVAAIVLAVSIIWLINTIIPVLFGSLKKILYFCSRKNLKPAKPVKLAKPVKQ